MTNKIYEGKDIVSKYVKYLGLKLNVEPYDNNAICYSKRHLSVLVTKKKKKIEVISVTSGYPQDGGWCALLRRLLRLCGTKDCIVHSTLGVIGCVISDSCTSSSSIYH